jgi:hypothetical protein
MKIHPFRASLRSAAIIVLALAFSCCAPMSNKNGSIVGALTGAAGGAAIGAVAGNQSGRAGEGALIGAGAGGMFGYENGPTWFSGDGGVQKTVREEEVRR